MTYLSGVARSLSSWVELREGVTDMAETFSEERDDEYTSFSPDNMMKITEFEEMSPEERGELEKLLAVAV